MNELLLGSFGWKKMIFVNWLLEMGADVNAADDKGITAIMVAVKRKDEDSIKFLMRAGADPYRKNKDGLSARKIAELKGPKRLLILLETAKYW